MDVVVIFIIACFSFAVCCMCKSILSICLHAKSSTNVVNSSSSLSVDF